MSALDQRGSALTIVIQWALDDAEFAGRLVRVITAIACDANTHPITAEKVDGNNLRIAGNNLKVAAAEASRKTSATADAAREAHAAWDIAAEAAEVYYHTARGIALIKAVKGA